MSAEEVTAQLVDDLTAAGRRLGPVLGLDVADLIADRAAERAPLLAAQLCTDGDDRLVAQTVEDLLAALWPTGEVDPAWWRTPVGARCAASLGLGDTGAVTHSVAAAMLGVTPGTISQLTHRGTLARHPDGGVDRGAVLRRVAARWS